jgi:hypothetical protein
VDAPVHVVAAAKSTAPITTMQIYLDFKKVPFAQQHIDRNRCAYEFRITFDRGKGL